MIKGKLKGGRLIHSFLEYPSSKYYTMRCTSYFKWAKDVKVLPDTEPVTCKRCEAKEIKGGKGSKPLRR